MTAAFLNVTEIEGQSISNEQLSRMLHRYHWASSICANKDVLEVACGAGQGLEIIRRSANSLVAGDYSPEVLAVAQKVANSSVVLSVFGAEKIPFSSSSFDCIILFEALYYIPRHEMFFSEALRLLRPGGSLLISTANKDLYDFNPSPFATRYLGAADLSTELLKAGYSPKLWGYLDVNHVSFRQRFLRPIKALAARFGLMPRTMHGKEWLKKIFFGQMVKMPPTLADLPFAFAPPVSISSQVPDRRHKVIYCEAKKI